jgi:hypothetical protein
MKLNPKFTWGLAWTGLAVVLAVPSIDFVSGRIGGGTTDAAVLTSDIDPVKTETAATAEPTSTVTTVKTENGIRIVPAGSKTAATDPVDKVLESGKALPDYITDSKAPAKTETKVASLPQPVVAPTPFPFSARPRDIAVPALPTRTEPAGTTTMPTVTSAGTIAPPTTPSVATPTVTTPQVTAPVSPDPVVIVDEETLTGSIREPAGPVPPAPIVDDTENWDNESLRDYLERRGILDGSDSRSTARVTETDSDYDPDGFYLNEGPNGGDRIVRETRRERILRMLEEEDPETFTLF